MSPYRRKAGTKSELGEILSENLRYRIDEFYAARPHIRDRNAALAAASGVDKETVRRTLMNGTCTVRTLELIGTALGARPEDLLKPSKHRMKIMQVRMKAEMERRARLEARKLAMRAKASARGQAGKRANGAPRGRAKKVLATAALAVAVASSMPSGQAANGELAAPVAKAAELARDDS